MSGPSVSPAPRVTFAALVTLAALALAGCGAAGGFASEDSGTTGPDATGDVVFVHDAGAPRDGGVPRDTGSDASGTRTRPPRLVIEGPANGLWAAGRDPVVVTGSVTPATAPIASLTIGGEPVPVDADGRFSLAVTPKPGLNLLGFRAEAEDGGRAVDERAFFWGESNPPDALLAGAVRVHARPEFLDDDDDDPDDLARLVELLLENPEFLALLQDPIDTGPLTIQPTGVTVGDAEVDVFATDGVITFVVRLTDAVIRFDTVAAEGEAPSSGSIRAAHAELFLRLALDIRDGTVVAEPTPDGVDVTLDGFVMEADLIEGYFDELPAVVELVRGVVEEGIEAELGKQVGDLVGALLGALAFDFTYGETVPIRFRLVLDELHVTRDGLHVVLSAAASAPMGVGVHNAEIAGSFHTPSTPPPLSFTTAPIAFAVDDDLLNQLAFAYWYGGGLTNLEFRAEDMAELGATALPDVFTPLERVSVSATLPLVLTPQADVPDFPFGMSVGDMQAVLETGDGRRFAMFLSLAAGVGLDVSEDGGLVRLRADRRPSFVPVQVGAYAVPAGNDPGNVAALVRMMVPPILGRTNEGLPGFPVPAIPLSAFLDLPSVAMKEFHLPSIVVRTAGAEGHFVVLEGAPVMRDTPPEPPPAP